MQAEIVRTVPVSKVVARPSSVPVRSRFPRAEPLLLVGGGILLAWAALAFLVLREFAGLHALFR